MASVRLPELPKDKAFEEYVAAYLQADGKFIERNIIEKSVDEVLELDIIATQYDVDLPKLHLVEVKSGGWGFPDLFKVCGWMKYLNIASGALVAQEGKQTLDFYKSKAKGLGIDLSVIEDLSQTKYQLGELVVSETISDSDIATWRFSYWLERQLLKNLKQNKKCIPDKQRYKALENYFFELNSGVFFTRNITERLDKLFSTYKNCPNISAKCGQEIIGEQFDHDPCKLPEKVYKETFYECLNTDIQTATFIEHRARLAILKNAVDYNLFLKAGKADKIEKKLVFDFLGKKYEYSIVNLLPPKFKTGLDQLSKHRFFYRYPVFWQWFLWALGGFILIDYKDKEYELLSIKTGIPIEEIDNAFSAYEILFPYERGWLIQGSNNSNIKRLKMFPVPFAGIGANYRRMLYTNDGKYQELELMGVHTSST